MWSFHGSSYDWGKDDVVKLTPAFSQANIMGEMVKGGYGGGIPVVAFWTASSRRGDRACGDASARTLAIPAKVAADGRVNAEVDDPGEHYAQAG